MLVSELFRRLSFGELSNLSIGSEGSGQISEEGIPKLIKYTNDGLLKLFSRFLLKESSIIVEQVSHITNYHLKRQFAESSGSNEKYRYIKDLPNSPFQGDVIKILSVVDSKGDPRPLNDVENPRSVYTPQPDTLQIPRPIACQALGVMYQARHVPLNSDGEGILNQDIDIPFFLENALQSYIASLVYSHMNGQENKANSQEHFLKYETDCLDCENKDLVNNTFHTSFQKLEHRGFV